MADEKTMTESPKKIDHIESIIRAAFKDETTVSSEDLYRLFFEQKLFQTLSVFNSFMSRLANAGGLIRVGTTHFKLGDLDRGIETLIKSLASARQVKKRQLTKNELDAVFNVLSRLGSVSTRGNTDDFSAELKRLDPTAQPMDKHTAIRILKQLVRSKKALRINKTMFGARRIDVPPPIQQSAAERVEEPKTEPMWALPPNDLQVLRAIHELGKEKGYTTFPELSKIVSHVFSGKTSEIASAILRLKSFQLIKDSHERLVIVNSELAEKIPLATSISERLYPKKVTVPRMDVPVIPTENIQMLFASLTIDISEECQKIVSIIEDIQDKFEDGAKKFYFHHNTSPSFDRKRFSDLLSKQETTIEKAKKLFESQTQQA